MPSRDREPRHEQVKPVRPVEIASAFQRKELAKIPDVIIETFNDLIAKKFNGVVASFDEKDVLKVLKRKSGGTQEGMVNWNQVLRVFSSAGWEASWDREHSDLIFCFTAKCLSGV